MKSKCSGPATRVILVATTAMSVQLSWICTSVAVEEAGLEAGDVDARAALATRRMHWNRRMDYHLAVQVQGGVGKGNPYCPAVPELEVLS